VNTRKLSVRICRFLEAAQLKVLPYHAGKSSEERQNIENPIAAQSVDVNVATSSFRTGMDILQLRWVVLFQAPLSLLALAQSIGRVGRSNQAGEALILWEESDFRLNEWGVLHSERRKEDLTEVYHYLSKHQCRTQGLSRYFGAPSIPGP